MSSSPDTGLGVHRESQAQSCAALDLKGSCVGTCMCVYTHSRGWGYKSMCTYEHLPVKAQHR